jgi:molybdopterin/thiamine biosynthesis adenylyltransferase
MLGLPSDQDSAYRPLLFRLHQDEDLRQFAALLERTAGLVTHDEYRSQLTELIKTRHPARRFGEGEMHEEIGAALAGRQPAECGVWVYYPWSRRLVHVLEEDQFHELRTSRNLYKILPEEQTALRNKRLGVVGLSAGQAVAITMTMERIFGQIRLADFDALDLSNLNRLRCGIHNIGVRKVLIAAREIAEIDPYLDVVCYPEGLNEDNVDEFLCGCDGRSPLDLIVEECDNFAIKILLRHKARAARVPVVMHTSDRGMLDVERFDIQPQRPILHGLLGDLGYEDLRGLSSEQRVPLAMRILGGVDCLSPAAVASLMEIDQSICTWPQLASDVTMGGALTAETARRILLGQFAGSGRYFVDTQQIVCDRAEEAETATEVPPGCSDTGAATYTSPSEGVPQVPASAYESARELVRFACMAPSGGNNQPWKWLFDGRILHLHFDTRRAPVDAMGDFRGLASFAALGAAMENLRLAAVRLGIPVRIHELVHTELVTSATLPPIASVELCTAADGDAPPAFHSLADFIEQRRTSRRIGGRQILSAAMLADLRQAVESDAGVRLNMISSPQQLSELGEVLGACDRVRFLNRRLHEEMMAEMRFDAAQAARTRDGLDLATLDLSAVDYAGLQMCRSRPALEIVRRLGGGMALKKIGRTIAESAAAAGLITVPRADPASFYAAGKAMQRAWLTATRHDIAFMPACSPPYFFLRLQFANGDGFDTSERLELQQARIRYGRLFGAGDGEGGVMLFVLGMGTPTSARSLRRHVEDVLEVRGAESCHAG